MSKTTNETTGGRTTEWVFMLGVLLLGGGCWLVSPATAMIAVGSILLLLSVWSALR